MTSSISAVDQWGAQPSEQERPSVQLEDLFQLEFLQDAQLSPDGKSVVYSVMSVNEEDIEHSTIYLLSLATGESRPLTSGSAQDSTPRWAPDGSQIAFCSTRNGKAQLFLIPVDGGEARALTAFPQGIAEGPVWSPDGTQLAFTAPPQEEPRDPQLPYRVTRAVYRFDKMNYLDPVVTDIYVMDLAGGEPRALTQDATNNGELCWSPDGQRLLYMVTMFPESHRIGAALRTVEVSGESSGTIKEVVGTWGSVAAATWTPDGQRIVFIGTPDGQPIGTQDALWVLDYHPSDVGEPSCRTIGLDFKVGGGLQMDMPARFLRAPRLFAQNGYDTDTTGQAAFVQVQAGGRVIIQQITLDGPVQWESIVEEDASAYPLDVRGNHLLYFYSTPYDPVQLYAIDLNNRERQRLTELNATVLAQWDQPPLQRLHFPSNDGTMVEGWIMTPDDNAELTEKGGPYPTILYIHGGPHSAFGHIFSFDFRMLVSAGYAVLFINHRASTGYGDAFATQIKGDWGNLDYQDLMAGVDHAIALGLADADRLGCCGLSGGGNLTCWIVGQTDRFKAAVPENPVTNWVSFYGVSDIGPWFAVEQLGGHPHEIPAIYARCSPITYAHRCTTPTLLIQGEADWRCPAEQSEQFYSVLKANGCAVEMLRLPNSAHAGSIEGSPAIRRAHNEALLDWMTRYV